MEAMLFRVDDYTDKCKHTLQHLVREWYHGLDMDQFSGNWCDISVGTSLPKTEILNIYLCACHPWHATLLSATHRLSFII